MIEGTNTAHILIFEGFMDALSYLSHQNIIIPDRTILVLNSGTLKKQALDYVKSQSPEEISLYLDRDHMGDEVTQFLSGALSPIIHIHDKRQSFAPYKDFNAWHIAYKNAHPIP